MKKILATFLFLATTSLTFAQQSFLFSLNGNNGSYSFVQTWQLVEFYADLTNVTNDTIKIDIFRPVKNFPEPDWSSSICLSLSGTGCYAPWVDTASVVIAPGLTQSVRLTITSGGNPTAGQAKVILDFYNDANHSDKISQSYYVSTGLVTSLNSENKVLSSFKLSQNYPNPFNPTTQISLSVEKNGFGKLSIFNVLGQKIQTLASQKFVAGKNYTFEWNGKDFNGKSVSTGIYFYKFELDGLSKTRKMVLTK